MELQHALALEEGKHAVDPENVPDIGDMVDACVGLNTVDDKSSVIRLVHHTATRYLGTHMSWFESQANAVAVPNEPLAVMDAHKYITATCITYLSFDNLGTGICQIAEDFEDRERSYALYEYASLYWGHNAYQARSEDISSVTAFLEDGTKVSSSRQVVMAHGGYKPSYYCSHKVLRETKGIHLAAYFRLIGTLWSDTTIVPGGKFHYVLLKWLLQQKNVDLNSTDKEGLTPLFWAVRKGHKMTAKALIAKRGIEINCRDQLGQSPLMMAAADGHEAIVRLLLEDGVEIDVNTRDFKERTPLLKAIMYGHESVAMALLHWGADVNIKDVHDLTALGCAAHSGLKGVVKMLLSEETCVNLNDENGRGETALSLTAHEGHAEVVEMLLNRAAAKGHLEVVRVLLKDGSGVNVNTVDEKGRTPLSWALQAKHTAVAKLLLKNGAWCVPYLLMEAAQLGHKDTVLSLLKEDKTHMNVNDSYGMTKLSLAASNGHADIVQLLAENGANANEIDFTGWTVLNMAASAGHKSVVQKLLVLGAGVQEKSESGRTALYMAALNGHEEVVRLLLERAPHVNAKTKEGKTALQESIANHTSRLHECWRLECERPCGALGIKNDSNQLRPSIRRGVTHIERKAPGASLRDEIAGASFMISMKG